MLKTAVFELVQQFYHVLRKILSITCPLKKHQQIMKLYTRSRQPTVTKT